MPIRWLVMASLPDRSPRSASVFRCRARPAIRLCKRPAVVVPVVDLSLVEQFGQPHCWRRSEQQSLGEAVAVLVVSRNGDYRVGPPSDGRPELTVTGKMSATAYAISSAVREANASYLRSRSVFRFSGDLSVDSRLPVSDASATSREALLLALPDREDIEHLRNKHLRPDQRMLRPGEFCFVAYGELERRKVGLRRAGRRGSFQSVAAGCAPRRPICDRPLPTAEVRGWSPSRAKRPETRRS